MPEQLKNEINGIPITIIHELDKKVSKIMNTSGMFYRIFTRKKSGESVCEKMQLKGYDAHKKLQDLFGIRIALYFKDDIPICRNLIEMNFHIDNVAEDTEDNEHFKPTRLNYVCKIPEDIKKLIPDTLWDKYPIDDTFEIQIRTVFSEGWHEIEHDLRYKCKEDWTSESETDRALNGIFATLETCDWSILTMFDNLSYKMYQKNNWKAMIRNKFRIRFTPEELDKRIIDIFNNNKSVAKDLLKIDRENLIISLSNKEFLDLPKSYNNLIFITNALYMKNQEILNLTPSLIKDLCS